MNGTPKYYPSVFVWVGAENPSYQPKKISQLFFDKTLSVICHATLENLVKSVPWSIWGLYDNYLNIPVRDIRIFDKKRLGEVFRPYLMRSLITPRKNVWQKGSVSSWKISWLFLLNILRKRYIYKSVNFYNFWNSQFCWKVETINLGSTKYVETTKNNTVV